jgi:hypothetical protein
MAEFDAPAEIPDPDAPDAPVGSVAPGGSVAPVALDTPVEPATDGRRAAATGRARRAALVSLRVAAGTIGLATALAIVAAVGLVALPTHRVEVPTVVVTPTAAEQVRLCPGALLRLGDATGENASTSSPIGAPSVRSGGFTGAGAQSQGRDPAVAPLATTDAGTGGTDAAPRELTIPPASAASSATLAGAQSQVAQDADYSGFAAAACSEPSGSIWLVGGSTAVGRTTLLTVANPSAVDATVALTILGPQGSVSAPGLSGILVKSGQQRVIPLAGFAPDLAAPVVHVVARGGQVTASLQQSTVRGLDAGGVDLVSASADPATHVMIPGIRVVNAVGVNRALALPDWDDVVAAVRVAVPGSSNAKVQVRLIPQDASLTGLAFEMDVAAGQASELPLDSGAETDSGGVAIPDGSYTVVLDSDQPVVGGVRVSTVVDTPGADATTSSDTVAPPSDFAWYASAPALTGDTAVSIAPGPSPVLSAMNPGTTALTVSLIAEGGADLSLSVPAGAAASVPVVPGASYLLRGGAGLSVTISYVGDARIAAYPVASARAVSGPIAVHP